MLLQTSSNGTTYCVYCKTCTAKSVSKEDAILSTAQLDTPKNCNTVVKHFKEPEG